MDLGEFVTGETHNTICMYGRRTLRRRWQIIGGN